MNEICSSSTRRGSRKAAMFDGTLVSVAAREAFAMLNPRRMAANPVMFVTEIGAILTTLIMVADIMNKSGSVFYTLAVTVILWATVLFANFAEALAEARGKAQADTLKMTRARTSCRKLEHGQIVDVMSDTLKQGDVVIVRAGETIPTDGEVIEGAASVDESAITGESAPVLREAGGDRSGVTGGTRVLSDEIHVLITAGAGDSFLDRMITLVEGAVRQKTPNECALTVTLAGLTLAFLLVAGALYPMGLYFDVKLSIPTLIALLVCLIPTTIGALLAAIGLAGMDRALSANVLAKSGKAVELAGDVDTLLLDKTGTITEGKLSVVEMSTGNLAVFTDLQSIAPALAADVVTGIAASGRTPYVLGVVRQAAAVGAKTIGITTNPDSILQREVDICIAPVTGPEALTGSTRMKSGTAQKLVLNMLTTATMIKLGKAYGNRMVDLNATNGKLVDRARRIFRDITGGSEEKIRREMDNVKNRYYILMYLSGLEAADAQAALDENADNLRQALSRLGIEAPAAASSVQ